ncbi:DEAD-box ATP-dependent RNA helicase 42 [Sorghum bicolor]|uniref:RNA helicase n=1 Tax=Sorghum bicolor TaxID=4558 RepID=C5YMI1_SORBI|nr:DEAD-box ATP-dependent RNA helicase 42 [Sorghum bicolor]EES14464.1 hypothetical protein SORBI_3007G023800 [Sorghum bicolor]|eukprot:XP_002444969.1 DEAD-box ATP-dependent RNA helicase 42 [Sorghum bicolor]
MVSGDDNDRDRDRDRDRNRDRDRDRSSSRHHRDRHHERSSSHHRRDDRDFDWDRGRDRRHRGEKDRDRDEQEREWAPRREERRDRERSRRRDADEEYDDSGRDRKRHRVSSHHHRRDTEPEAAPATKDQEGGMRDEQQRLDDEMERRRIRVKDWQEKRRKQQGASGAGPEAGGGAVAGKKWTLEGEDSDEEADGTDLGGSSVMDVDFNNGGNATSGPTDADEEEIDPLDAFMNTMVLPEVAMLERNAASVDSVPASNAVAKKGLKKGTGRIMQGDDSDSDYEDVGDDVGAGLEDEDDEEFMKRVKKTKMEKLGVVDHSKIDYQPFQKNFYIEAKDIREMTSEEVAVYRKELELKVHGKDVPKPIKTWLQSGQTSKLLDTIKKLGFEKPMPIQAQALPVIMSGRDCIGVAKTGSGKTLAFLLPMLRHVKDQPPVAPGDGPVGLIVAPTRELVVQIYLDIKKFSKVLGISCVAVYGGSGVAQQISELKRGAEIVVCTPGRMIDILCTSNGKITNLRRVTFLVMDEADRMFDMGFEPQITRIIQNIRRDRQTVLFSATFPRQVEMLARKVLIKPVEIQVGGRSVVNKDITQVVEVRPESERFLRLLELLGKWCDKGKILVFVHTQDKCDSLLKNLFQHGYQCLSLHGGKDQADRESTVADFKSNICSLLIATSVAARGLDVKELELVVNYDVPNHYEDYVHRVGRTGRAGRKGSAVTFISEEEERYAPDLVKALELSEQTVPDDLKALADRFMAKVKQGTERTHGTGYGGSGFKFNEEEDEARKFTKKAQAMEYGYEEEKSDSDFDEEEVHKAGDDLDVQAVGEPSTNDEARLHALEALARIQRHAVPDHYEAELEINDFPQHARWRITHKDTLGPIQEGGVAITIRGTYIAQGKIVGANERKLYLFIEGHSESCVKKAKAELKRVLEDCVNQVPNLPKSAPTKKYSVI